MRRLLLSIGIALVFIGPGQSGQERLYQVSTIEALLAGLYDGSVEIGEVLEQGDFGLGTFDRLDGELILLDGEIYQAAFDGSVNRMPPETRTPFIALTQFEADQRLRAEAGLTFAEFKTWLEGKLPSRNLIYGVRVDGRFRDIVYRSVPRQEQKPYPPLVDVVRRQAVFRSEDIGGTLLGFWCPDFTAGLNVPGFHLHFLSDDRRHAGHVLDFSIDGGEVQLDLTNGLELQLPVDSDFLGIDLGTDQSGALRSVERGGNESVE